MDSVDLKWENEEPNQNKPPRWRLYFRNEKHICKPKHEPEPEKIVTCPKGMCGKKMVVTKLQEHIKKEHLGFY
tara:strand:- start:5435 stop:5653 length:219 start_codon:yes stop_codon:yes gene_type:complete